MDVAQHSVYACLRVIYCDEVSEELERARLLASYVLCNISANTGARNILYQVPPPRLRQRNPTRAPCVGRALGRGLPSIRIHHEEGSKHPTSWGPLRIHEISQDLSLLRRRCRLSTSRLL